MKHPLQDKGWQQMHEILDREMPVNKRKYRLVFLLLALLGAGIMSYFLMPKDKQIDTPISKEPIAVVEQKMNTTSILNDSESNANIEDNTKIDAENQKEIEVHSSVHSIDLKLNDRSKNAKLKSSQLAKSEFVFQENPSESVFQDRVSNVDFSQATSLIIDKTSLLANADNRLIEPQQDTKELFQNLNQSDSKIYTIEEKALERIENVKYPFMIALPTINSGFVFKSKIDMDFPSRAIPKVKSTNQPWEKALSLGIGQNVANIGSQNLWTSFMVGRKVSNKTQLVASTGVSLHKFNLESSKLADKLENSIPLELNNESIHISPSSFVSGDISLVFVDISLGIRTKVNNRFAIGLGTSLSYLMTSNLKATSFPIGFSTDANRKFSQSIKQSFNRLYSSVFLNASFNINDNWSLISSYNHDFSGLSKTPATKGDQFYFRDVKLGIQYKF